VMGWALGGHWLGLSITIFAPQLLCWSTENCSSNSRYSPKGLTCKSPKGLELINKSKMSKDLLHIYSFVNNSFEILLKNGLPLPSSFIHISRTPLG
jgi:hypothetical protein